MIFDSSQPKSPKSRMSEDDNETAGRLLLMGFVAAAGAALLIVSPVLILGFGIGLMWYGAYVADGEANGERLLWPIAITMAVFIYFLGFPPPFKAFQGVLFTDFYRWTSNQVHEVLSVVNELLPRKWMIHALTVRFVRIYGWSVIPVAFGMFAYLHFRGQGRGIFLYRGIYQLLAPLRWISKDWNRLLPFTITGILGVTLLNDSWARIAFGGISIFTLIYAFRNGVEEEKANDSENQIIKTPILLGYEKEKSYVKVKLTDEQLNHHVHIVGASGFGKSVLLSHIIENRTQSGDGLLFIDLKADFETIRQVVSVVKNLGRENDLRIFSCGNPEFSVPYNVVRRGTANQLKDRIMGALNWSEEFYKNEAASFLLKLLRGLTLLRDKKGKDFDLGTILKCAEDPKHISFIINDLNETDSRIQNELRGLMGHVGKPENFRSLQGLRSQLESLLLSDFGHLLKGSGGVDIFEAINSKKIVYILLDSRTYGESSRSLGKLILQDLKAASAKIDNEIPKAERNPFTVVVDEFADLASEDFIGFLDRARSSKIGVVVAHQEIADLAKVSPEFARRLMNSTSTLFAFLQKLGDSSNIIAEVAGTRKTKEVTEQAKSNWLFGDEKTGMKSIKEVDEFVVHPNVIRSLAVGECVCIQKYPRSKSAVIRVRPESKDRIQDEEVKNILEKIKGVHCSSMETLVKDTVVASVEIGPQTGRDTYWNNDNNQNLRG